MEGTVHHRVWEQEVKPWKPVATYTLLGIMAAVFFLQRLSLGQSIETHNTIWTIAGDWATRPWSPITSTFAHADLGHIFINGLMLFFFGPQLERLLGRSAYVSWFLAAGAISGILQAELSAAWGLGIPALGASGAIMFVFAALVVLFPNNTLLLYGIVPLKFWIAGVLFAILDIIGAFNPFDKVGNFAHLAGALIGLGLGFGLRANNKLRFAPRTASPYSR